MSNQNPRDAGQKLKAALDKIIPAKNDPAQLQQAITEAKQLADQIVAASEQGGQQR